MVTLENELCFSSANVLKFCKVETRYESKIETLFDVSDLLKTEVFSKIELRDEEAKEKNVCLIIIRHEQMNKIKL